MKMSKFGILAAGAVALSSALCYGSIVVNPGDGILAGEEEGWVAGGLGGWQSEYKYLGNGSAIVSGGGPYGNYLSLSFSDTGVGIFFADTSTTATYGSFTGPLRPTGVATFRFDAGTLVDGLGLYFRSGNGNEWVRYVTPTANWQTYGGLSLTDPNLSNWGLVNWESGNNDGDQLLADLANVNRFGIWVEGRAGQTYGLDDIGIIAAVPEPETIWLLMAALASLGITFRGKIGSVASDLMKRT